MAGPKITVIGAGGIFRALREIPHALAMAKDAARLAAEKDALPSYWYRGK